MKKLTAFLVSVLATAALNAAVIEQVIVRQQWPWSTDVKVEYKLSAVTNPVDIAVQAFNGATELALPAEAITGDRYGIAEDGVGTLVIDPVAAFGTAKIALANFKVKLTVTDSPENLNETLYKIFCLTNGTCENVTRKDLLNGKWGAVETEFSKIGSGFSTALKDVVIWTGVTNNPAYKTTHLVMRKIPAAKAGEWTMGAPTGEPGRAPTDVRETQHQVTLTENFYIGVFEWTEGQKRAIFNKADFNERSEYPWTQATWDNGASYFSTLNSMTGAAFEFPTEAQWEFACRAGTATGLNSGKDWGESYEAGPDKDAVSEIGWVRNLPGVVTNENHPVGQLRPNAFGLYDMIGNVSEWCQDWFYNGALGDLNQLVDPTGPASDSDPGAEANNKCHRGGSVGAAYYDARCAARSRAHKANSWQTTYIGWRLFMRDPEG